MTNNWTDIGNASAVLVMGANPSENHPACMAHINAARKNGGKLVVVDPRKNRTALQCNPDKGERFIRLRPGTDIALLNGIVRRIMEKMNTGAGVDPAVRTKFFQFLNENSAGTFWTDGSATGASTSVATVAGSGKYTDARFLVNTAGTDYVRETVGAGDTAITGLPVKSTDCRTNMDVGGTEYMTVYNRMWQHVNPYTPQVVQDITGVSPTDLEFLADLFIDNSRCSSVGPITGVGSQDPRQAGYKCLTMLYAMGQTQHTYGAQNVKAFAVIQVLMGNAGRAGGGINALRGIHNVQGSTDQGLLQGNIPFYSGNPTVMTSADANAFGKYMDALWGSPVSGTGTRAQMDKSYDDAYNNGAYGLQQRGFMNMTYDFFGGGAAWKGASPHDRTLTNGLYDLWPKTNGDMHTTMFRKMAAGTIKGCVAWGQNPAVTQPYQSAVRQGLKNLDVLVVVEMFETETAAVDRKEGAPTYLIPASSHLEEAGSVANSGRVLQWREQACKPKGNTKSDLELIFRLAYAFDKAGAFSHITAQWSALGRGTLNAYDVLYGDRYGFKPGTSADFEELSGTAEIWRGDDAAPTTGTVYGSEWIAEQIYRSMNLSAAGGTSWLYTGAYDTNMTLNKHAGQADWLVANRSKSRAMADPNNTRAFPGWGYSWLVNRRVLYNNGDIPGDVADFYMGPDSVARLFVTTQGAKGVDLNYSRWYRFYHLLADKPSTGLGDPHHLPGRFPAHTEPYETPRQDLANKWGRNTHAAASPFGSFGGPAAWNLVPDTTPVVGKNRTVADLAASHGKPPLVLTTIRCVEHFQGGPITRNNPWNVEAEPEPWVEINSVDAAARGIKTGDWVNVFTVRGDSTTAGQQALSPNSGATSQGFRARVGVGAEDNQRVGVGVVAIPWHWGDKGLSVGARANDLCIDAGDANTTIPESKACLCQIEKM